MSDRSEEIHALWGWAFLAITVLGIATVAVLMLS